MELWKLLLLALLTALCGLFHILSCVLWNNWLPFVSLVGYALAPCTIFCFARSRGDGFGEGNKTAQHWAEFATAVLLTAFVGVPVVMYRSRSIEHGAMLMEISGSVLALTVVFLAVFFSVQPDLRQRLGV